jgi:histidine kinase/DNA gyrase B/HSP90-like ATPase
VQQNPPPGVDSGLLTIDATPQAADLWAGIAGHFDSISQVISEFLDNSISNFEARKVQPRSIQVNVEELGDNVVQFRIEDTGSGIEHLAPCVRLGDKSVRETPLNEHGFGLKHALASADPDNNTWVLYTRTKADFQKGQYYELFAPYDFHMSPRLKAVADAPWPGAFNGSGTIVQFKCSSTFFKTIVRGVRGPQAGFSRCLDYLTEELGYIYSGIIEKGKATISVTATGDYNKTVEAIKPQWVDFYPPGSGTDKTDLGNVTSPTFCTMASERVYITTSSGKDANGGLQGAEGDRRAAICGANAAGAGGL